MIFTFRDWRERLEELRRQIAYYNPNDRRIYTDDYDCIHCGRDVRMGGTSDGHGGNTCNRCLGRETGLLCDACNLNHRANHPIRIRNMPRTTFVERQAGEITPLEERTLWLCDECWELSKTNANEVLAPFAINSCDNCMDYFRGVPYRMTMGGIKKDWCGSCMIKFIKSFISLEFIPVGSKITRKIRHMTGSIEFKNNMLFVWNPKKVVLTREDGHYMTLELEIEGDVRGNMPYDTNMFNMMIKDGNVIWIAKECNLSEASMSSWVRDRMLGSMDLYEDMHPRVHNGIELKLTIQHINFKLEDQAQQEVQRRRVQRDVESLNEVRRRYSEAQSSLNDLVAAHRGERVNINTHLPRVTSTRGNHDLATPYYDRDGRILVQCSCGYQRRMHIPRNGLLHHQQLTFSVPDYLSVPGSYCSYEMGDHVVTIRSSINRNEDLADLR